jgi:hypothetical protein
MSDVDQKLRRGFELIERSGGDSDLLGVALLAIHGALEDHFRATLSARPELNAKDREILAERSVGWLTLVNLMQKYGALTSTQRRAILEANDLRQSFAHGRSFTGRLGSMLRYARFAETLCGRTGLLDQVLIEQRYTRAERADYANDAAYADERPVQPRSGISLSQFVSIAAIILLLVLGIWLYNQRDSIKSLFSAPAAPSALLNETAVLPPTPAPQRARVIGLAGGPGWLHDSASFDSGTLPIALSEGMEVVVLDQEQTDADGQQWRYVSVGGYEGWCPSANLAIE